ncbi:unnamed protein product [Rotaria socialis]|nr:unnamed protein product [Rotaria socialis]CAF3439963.1 unnamed protein product [Rotaria socialis]CAF3557719.1 unnamed protein product [Rotaria socialis]CAF3614947.1 unnamed protein product [Rotaria socialis]CAF3636300.1 unnamed protein product [Rotaria socialis]
MKSSRPVVFDQNYHSLQNSATTPVIMIDNNYTQYAPLSLFPSTSLLWQQLSSDFKSFLPSSAATNFMSISNFIIANRLKLVEFARYIESTKPIMQFNLLFG